MSSLFYVFLGMQFCLGALVGVNTAQKSEARGFVIALLLGLAAIVECVAIATHKMHRGDINLIAQVASTMVFGVVLWGISLFCTSIGYWSAFWISRRLSNGRGQFGILALLAFVAIYGIFAALGRMM